MTQLQLVLASSSRYRQRLLERLRVPFDSHEHLVDEGEVPGLGALEIAPVLAERKARSLRPVFPGRWILGSDQCVVLGETVIGKPGGRDGARQQLEMLAGRTHQLVTAMALLAPDGALDARVVENQMEMRPLTADEIERYLDADEPYDCCGSYKVESLGISLFSAIGGDDFTAIEGLPLIGLSELLRGAGFQVP